MGNRNIIPGEWRIDDQGRKYRMVGSCKEYAPVIQTTKGTFYAEEIPEHNRIIREDTERRQKEQSAAVKTEPRGYCPVRMARGVIQTLCSRDCSFLEDSGCVLALTDLEPTKDTKGTICQLIGRKCMSECVCYKSGCTLSAIIKGLMKPGKE